MRDFKLTKRPPSVTQVQQQHKWPGLRTGTRLGRCRTCWRQLQRETITF